MTQSEKTERMEARMLSLPLIATLQHSSQISYVNITFLWVLQPFLLLLTLKASPPPHTLHPIVWLMSLTLLQPLSAVSHGSVPVCFLPLLNQMGCVFSESQSQRSTERQRTKGHPQPASGAVCLHFLTIALHGCATPSFFPRSCDKITTSSYEEEEERNAGLFRTASTLHDCTLGFQRYLLLHCPTATRAIPSALSLAPLLISLFQSFSFPCTFHLSISSHCWLTLTLS